MTVLHLTHSNQNFLPRLQAHLLARHQGITFTGDEPRFEPSELNGVIFQHGRIFSHATACFNYTTYDIRREQDTINVNGQRRDIIIPSYEDTHNGNSPHPYWYARVIGIFHAKVFFRDSRSPTIMKFLWVRWFGRDPQWTSGPSSLRLDRVGFVPEDDPEAFGFLDPTQVIRACHLVPAFVHGKSLSLLSPSIVRDSDTGDWVNYYAMRYVSYVCYNYFCIHPWRSFVDRDMMMRYLGLGIGHQQAQDFPRENNLLKPVPSGDTYIYTDWDRGDGPADHAEEEKDNHIEELEEESGEIGYEY